jgi:hypothetical protein
MLRIRRSTEPSQSTSFISVALTSSPSESPKVPSWCRRSKDRQASPTVFRSCRMDNETNLISHNGIKIQFPLSFSPFNDSISICDRCSVGTIGLHYSDAFKSGLSLTCLETRQDGKKLDPNSCPIRGSRWWALPERFVDTRFRSDP